MYKIKDSKGKYIASISHQALVSDELFFRVQEKLKENKVSIHYTEKLDLPLRGVIGCSKCNRVYTPYIKKGIHYYNSRCKKNCANYFKNFNFAYVSQQIGRLIKNLYFTDEEPVEMNARTGTEISSLEQRRHNELGQL